MNCHRVIELLKRARPHGLHTSAQLSVGRALQVDGNCWPQLRNADETSQGEDVDLADDESYQIHQEDSWALGSESADCRQIVGSPLTDSIYLVPC